MQPSCSCLPQAGLSQPGLWPAGPDPQDVAALNAERSQPLGQHVVASSGQHADTRLQQASELHTQPSAHEVPFAAEEPEVGHHCAHVCLEASLLCATHPEPPTPGLLCAQHSRVCMPLRKDALAQALVPCTINLSRAHRAPYACLSSQAGHAAMPGDDGHKPGCTAWLCIAGVANSCCLALDLQHTLSGCVIPCYAARVFTPSLSAGQSRHCWTDA